MTYNYEIIAEVIRDFLDNQRNEQLDAIYGVRNVAEQVAERLGRSFYDFDKAEFLRACGLEVEEAAR